MIGDLSSGFNLIRGESDSGKTSVVRALCLVAYNEWDPRSLRVGCTNCEVKVTTERGTVKVTRGKDNRWEVTPVGGPTETFTSIGTKILPEVSEILGMRIVELGDNEIHVNVMDQLERHFMLAELDGKKVSGSVRAQIVDEISGLTGIEALIRDVSLDNTRNARQVKEQEDAANDYRSQMHDQSELDEERTLLELASSQIERAQGLRNDVDVMLDHFSEHKAVGEQIEGVNAEVAALPDEKAAESLLTTAHGVLERAGQMTTAYGQAQSARRAVADVEAELVGLPDEMAAEPLLLRSGELAEKSRVMRSFLSDVESARDAVRVVKLRLRGCDAELREAEDEYYALLETFTVCPLTMGPIGEQCLSQIKVPVRSGERAEALGGNAG